MIQSNSNRYITEISQKYKSFTKEILPTLVGKNVCNMMGKDQKQNIFKYQEFLIEYMKDLNKIPEKDLKQRGLLVYHGMGSGKTFSGLAMAEVSRDYTLNKSEEDYTTKSIYKRKMILLIPANLLMDPWIKEIGSKCIKECKVRNVVKKMLKEMKDKKIKEETIKKNIINLLKEHDYHLIFYNAQNVQGGWKDKLKQIPTRKTTGDKYTNKYSERDNEFDDSVVIIDELHNLVNMFTNKIEKEEKVTDEGLMLYYKLFNAKNMRIIGLTYFY